VLSFLKQGVGELDRAQLRRSSCSDFTRDITNGEQTPPPFSDFFFTLGKMAGRGPFGAYFSFEGHTTVAS